MELEKLACAPFRQRHTHREALPLCVCGVTMLVMKEKFRGDLSAQPSDNVGIMCAMRMSELEQIDETSGAGRSFPTSL